MEALKKITVGGINNKRGGFEVKEGAADQVVGRIYGRADSCETKESNYGPFIRFKGQFRSLNAERKEAFAPVLILPAPADSMLAEAIKNDEAKMGVTFAFDVILRSIPKRSPVDRGYEYVVVAHQQGAAADPFKALADSLPALAALPAPETAQQVLTGTETPEPETTDAKPAAKSAKK